MHSLETDECISLCSENVGARLDNCNATASPTGMALKPQ